MSAQTQYSINQPVAKPGLVQGQNESKVDSHNNPVDEILFGHFVAKVASDDDGVKKPAAIGDFIAGVAVADLAQPDGKFDAKSAVPVLKKGDIWVPAEEAVAFGETPHIRYAGKGQVQTFVLDADLITGNVISVDVNGSTITHTFATDHLTSMTAFAVKIEAHADVEDATVGGSGNRTITITSVIDKTVLLENEGITGGASQAGIVITETVAAITTDDLGKLRNDTDSTTALDASAYVRIKQYDSTSGLALVSVDINY